MSTRISGLAGREQTAAYLDQLRTEFQHLEDFEKVWLQTMVSQLLGGARLADLDVERINAQLRANRYVGTGIQLAMAGDEKLPVIPKVFYDGPAWKSGVKAGDLILGIDSEPTAGKELSEVVEQLRGESGSEVNIRVRQPDTSDTRDLTVTRGRVFIPTVEGYREESSSGRWQFKIDSAEDVALIRIKSFGVSTLHKLRKAAQQPGPADLRGVVLDLRIGGGLLHDTVLVADSLLDGGTIGHIRSADSVKTHEARTGCLFQDVPLAVLVAKHTSSGNVFLAATLQDNQRAIVVGEPTASQTYLRSILEVPGGRTKIILPTAIMERGDGTPLLGPRRQQPTRLGDLSQSGERSRRASFIMPDHIVEVSKGQREAEDPTLAKAVDVLRNATAETTTDG